MPLSFGFAHVPSTTYRRHVELVQLAEQLGFDFAWIPDQTFYRDPYVILSSLALSTSTIRLGLGVTNPFTRHPAITGRAIATVADLAPARVVLGIGAGNVRELLDPLGLDHDAPADRCRETVELIHRELTGEPVEYTGEHYSMNGARLLFKPEPVPIYVAGRGPRVLEVAGEVGDGVLVGGLCSPSGIRYAVDRITAGARRANRDPAQLDIASWVSCQITADRAGALDRLRPVVAHIIGGAPAGVLQAIELAPETIAAVKDAYAAGGSDAAAPYVDDTCIDAFAIAGDAAHVVDRIRSLEVAGVTQFVFLMPPGDVDDYVRLLRELAES